jgi:hypothetical protein
MPAYRMGQVLMNNIVNRISPSGVEPETSGSGGQRSIQLSYGDEDFITLDIISACPHLLQLIFVMIFTETASGRHSGVSLSEQIVYCCRCFCLLLSINLTIILHCGLKVSMSSKHSYDFGISDVVSPVCYAAFS